jgi:hypothetical protein
MGCCIFTGEVYFRQISSRRVTVRTLRLIAAVGISAAVNIPAVSATLYAQSAQLTGVVLTSPDERPLADAEIVFESLKLAARSDSVGRYTLTGLPRGKHEVVVRHIGYKPFIASLVVGNAGTLDADFLLEVAPTTLATFDIKAELLKRYAHVLVDFESRRKAGFGKFLTPDIMESNSQLSFQALLAKFLPGVKVMDVQGSKVLSSSRGLGFCPVQVFVDHMLMYNGGNVFYDVSMLNADRIVGVEFYTLMMTPMEFMTRPRGGGGGSGCGTVIVWMKH